LILNHPNKAALVVDPVGPAFVVWGARIFKSRLNTLIHYFDGHRAIRTITQSLDFGSYSICFKVLHIFDLYCPSPNELHTSIKSKAVEAELAVIREIVRNWRFIPIILTRRTDKGQRARGGGDLGGIDDFLAFE
jgi:hypothetical protein